MAVEYYDMAVDEYKGNPLIEALPPLEPDLKSIGMALSQPLPGYGSHLRLCSQTERIALTRGISRFHQPLEGDIRTALAVDNCIRWGYVGRNPATPKYVKDMNDRYAGVRKREMPDTYYPNTYGFSLTGVSGVGKTSTLGIILNRYPQLIVHRAYGGMPFPTEQVVWLKVDCPCDASLKSLCLDFFREMDIVTGKDYRERFKSQTLDSLVVHMADVASKENLGLLVIDEIQHLCAARSQASTKALNFLVSMVNRIGVPVVVVGTPAAKPLLQQDFQQAKRVSGHGNMVFGSMMKGSPSWELFTKAMWNYQFTRKSVSLTAELNDALFEETFGIQFLVSVLYMLVQERAIIYGKEEFDASDIHKTADESLSLTKPMREALKKKEDVDIKKYLEKMGILDAYQTQCIEIDPVAGASTGVEQGSPAPKPEPRLSVTDQATEKLVALGIAYREARKCVLKAQEDSPKTIQPETLAMKAAALYFSKGQETVEPQKSPLDGVDGYEAAKEAGVVETNLGGGEPC